MSVLINADTSDGLKFTSDTSGEIKLQSAGTDIATVSSSGIDVTGDFTIADKIIHSGDTNTAIRFPSADTVTVETGGTERMRIDSGGGVFFGKTTTAETTAGWYLSPGAGNVGLSSGNYFVMNYVPGGASTMIDFRTGGVSKGNISQNGTNTAYNTSSDYRLKENVTPMSGSIDRLKQLKPSTWSWVQDGSHGEGFLAHEAQSVVPEAVTGTKDAVDDEGNPVYQGIDQSKLVPLLTAALQEAITKIEDLETRIQALENA